MTPLNPDLKRLMRWARQAPGPDPDPMPPGFCAGVLARLDREEPSVEFALWQRAVWGCAWAATALIIVEVMLLGARLPRAHSFYHLPAPDQIVAAEFVP